MRKVRLLMLALSIVALGACTADPMGPARSSEGYSGSGGQLSPLQDGPSLTEGYSGSGG